MNKYGSSAGRNGDEGTAGRLLVIGGGGDLGVKRLQKALLELGLGARADCLELRPARPGEVAVLASDDATK